MSLCPSANNTIVAGYVAAAEPYHADCIRRPNWQKSCKRPGFVIELWQLLARTLRCHLQLVQFFDFGAFAPEANSSWGGMMEALANGTIDATASHLVLTSARIEAFQSASVFGYAFHQFVAKTSLSKERELNLAVFSWPTFALLFISVFMCGIIYHFHYNNHYGRLESFWDSCDELMHFIDRRKAFLSYFLSIACLFLQLIYFAEFRSRAVKERYIETARFDKLIEDFHSGRRKLVITNIAHVKNADKLLLFGKADMINDSRLILMDSYEAAVEKICENDAYLLLGNLIELKAMRKEHQLCNYGPIQITSGSEADILLYHMSSFVPRGILFATHVEKEVVKTMNEIILKLFKDADFDNYWYPRYRTKFGTETERVMPTSAIPSPIGLLELKDGFKFWFAGIGISTGLFLVTILYSRKRRPISTLPINASMLRRNWYLPKFALSVYILERPKAFDENFHRSFGHLESYEI